MTKSHLAPVFLLSLLVHLANGQTSAPPADSTTTDPTRAKPPSGLRAWIFPAGKDTGPVEFALGRGPDAPPSLLGRSEAGAKSAGGDYQTVPEGAVALSLLSGKETLASAQFSLSPGGYYTAVAWETAGKWEIKIFRDAAAKADAAARPLRVLNFTAGRDTLLGMGGKESRLSSGTIQEMSLPAKINMLSIKVADASGGPPAETNVELDFTLMPLAYAVIGPDYRGRMRPEIIEGGPPQVVATAPLVVPQIDPVQQAKLERERRAENRRLERSHLAGQLAILEAQIKEGVNLPEDAAGLKQELQKKLKDLEKEPAPPATPAAPAR